MRPRPRTRRWPAITIALLCVPFAYYAAQWARDRRGLVGEILATPGEPTSRGAIDVTRMVRPHVPVGMEKEAAVEALERGGFDVEVYSPARYEWLRLTCPECDEGMWGRYAQSILRGGEAVTVGIGLRGGRVVHVEAHRTLREFYI